ncbi:hypothetical protein [Halopiger djelfimassiliensis]|uniref:hypothetical protein n=1 Tax=Halopiger djelfimassiliensis TaxID=1293047 RepID=UPI0006779935|nr:hypothetical protein [Halopiger djelfimassiliensis]
MQSQERFSGGRLEPVPEQLDSPQAKLVYIYLEAADGATVDELSRVLTMKKIDILSVLNTLTSAELVENAGESYVVAE